MTTNKHIGSDSDEFLESEGLLAEAEATAVKRAIAYQIRQETEARRISKSELTRMMKTSRSSLDRLFDPDNRSVTLLTMETAAYALGKKLEVQIASSPDSCFSALRLNGVLPATGPIEQIAVAEDAQRQ